MGASAHVGRIGGLAVALGVGLALNVAGQGTASAAPSDSSAGDTAGRASAADAASPSRPARYPRGGGSSAAVFDRSGNGQPEPGGKQDRQTEITPRSASSTRGPDAASLLDLPARAAAPAIPAQSADQASVRVATLIAASHSALVYQAPDTQSLPRSAAATPVEAATTAVTNGDPQPAGVTAALGSVPAPAEGTDPSAPAELAVSWLVAAAARRELTDQQTATAAPGRAAAAVISESSTPLAAAAAVEAAAATAEATAPSFAEIIQYTLFHKAATAAPAQAPGQSSSGVVTGNLNVSSGDAAQVVYTVVEGPTRGSVTLGADGAYTYTPDPGLALDGGTDSFRVTIDNSSAYKLTGISGALQGIVHSLAQAIGLSGADTITVSVPVTITASQLPFKVATTSRPTYTTTVAADGSVYQTSTAVASGKYTTTVTVLRPDGSADTFTQPGTTDYSPVVGPDGTVYQSSTGTTSGSPTAYLRAIHPDGSVSAYELGGIVNRPPGSSDIAFSEDGSAHWSVLDGNATQGYTATILTVRPDGTSTSHSQPGMASTAFATAPDGTVYFVTDKAGTTYLTAFRPGGAVGQYTYTAAQLLPPNWIDGSVRQLAYAPDGTAYLILGGRDATFNAHSELLELRNDGTLGAVAASGHSVAVNPNTGQILSTRYTNDQLELTVKNPDGTEVTMPWASSSWLSGGSFVFSGSDAYQVQDTGGGITTIAVVHADATTSSYTQQGAPWSSSVSLRSDGSVALSTALAVGGPTVLQIIHPDGTRDLYTQPGQPNGGTRLGVRAPDGTLYQTTNNAGVGTALLRAYRENGQTTDWVLPYPLATNPVLGSDGSLYLAGSDQSGTTTYVTVARPGQQPVTQQLTGTFRGEPIVTDTAVYQLTSTGLWIIDRT